MKTLVLGIGSPFADDKAGWLVANQLLLNQRLQDKIKSGELLIESTDRPGLNLLIWLGQDYQQIILIDMVKTNLNEVGNIYQLQAREILGFSGMLSSHNLGVSPSLALADALGLEINHVSFWGVEGLSVAPEVTINPAVLLAVDKVVGQVIHQLI